MNLVCLITESSSASTKDRERGDGYGPWRERARFGEERSVKIVQFLPSGLKRIRKAQKMAFMVKARLLHHTKRRKTGTPTKIQGSRAAGGRSGRRSGSGGDGGGGTASDHRLQIPIFLHEFQNPKRRQSQALTLEEPK